MISKLIFAVIVSQLCNVQGSNRRLVWSQPQTTKYTSPEVPSVFVPESVTESSKTVADCDKEAAVEMCKDFYKCDCDNYDYETTLRKCKRRVCLGEKYCKDEGYDNLDECLAYESSMRHFFNNVCEKVCEPTSGSEPSLITVVPESVTESSETVYGCNKEAAVEMCKDEIKCNCPNYDYETTLRKCKRRVCLGKKMCSEEGYYSLNECLAGNNQIGHFFDNICNKVCEYESEPSIKTVIPESVTESSETIVDCDKEAAIEMCEDEIKCNCPNYDYETTLTKCKRRVCLGKKYCKNEGYYNLDECLSNDSSLNHFFDNICTKLCEPTSKSESEPSIKTVEQESVTPETVYSRSWRRLKAAHDNARRRRV